MDRVFSYSENTDQPCCPFPELAGFNCRRKSHQQKRYHQPAWGHKSRESPKNLSLWESRYSKSYLEIEGKKENILGLWNSFDYISLDYRIDQLRIQPQTASAQITWDMKLRLRKTGQIIRKIQTLSADFVRENKTFKISAVRRKAL